MGTATVFRLGRQLGRPDIDAFEAVMAREDRSQGFFVSFDYSQDALSEIQAFLKKTGKIIRPITVKDILRRANRLQTGVNQRQASGLSNWHI